MNALSKLDDLINDAYLKGKEDAAAYLQIIRDDVAELQADNGGIGSLRARWLASARAMDKLADECDDMDEIRDAAECRERARTFRECANDLDRKMAFKEAAN